MPAPDAQPGGTGHDESWDTSSRNATEAFYRDYVRIERP